MASADADIAAKRKAAEADIAPAAAALAAEITGKLLGEKQDASHLAKHIANATS
jgi:F0F1-type ATP synthase membrane subunit b/b'